MKLLMDINIVMMIAICAMTKVGAKDQQLSSSQLIINAKQVR